MGKCIMPDKCCCCQILSTRQQFPPFGSTFCCVMLKYFTLTQIIFLSFACRLGKTDIITLYRINWQACITQKKCSLPGMICIYKYNSSYMKCYIFQTVLSTSRSKISACLREVKTAVFCTCITGRADSVIGSAPIMNSSKIIKAL